MNPDDDARWALCLSHIPPTRELAERIRKLREQTPARSDAECDAREARTMVQGKRVGLSLRHLRDDDAWLWRYAARPLWELFASHFVPRLVQEIGLPAVDFDAAVDDGWGVQNGDWVSEATFRAYVARWVRRLADEDATFMGGSGFARRRRAWLPTVLMRSAGAAEDGCHQLLVVAEAAEDDAVAFYVVDNLRRADYDNARFPIHAWLVMALWEAAADCGWHVSHLTLLPNGMRTAYNGTCMYLSLRALMACALLETPWPYIEAGDLENDQRWELYVFAQLERIRGTLLASSELWDPHAPRAVVYAPGGGLRGLDTPYVWFVRVFGDVPVADLARWLRQREGRGRRAVRHYFVPELDALPALAPEESSAVCRVMARFRV